MASYSFIIDAMNDIVVDHDGEGGHVYWIDAVNEWCTALEGSGGHSSIIDGLNEVCTLLDGNGGHRFTIDAHNEISTLLGGTGGYRFDIDALNEIADLPLGGPSAPGQITLTWDENSADTLPNFDIGLPLDTEVDDVIYTEYSDDDGETWAEYFESEPLTQEQIAGAPIEIEGVTPLAAGDYLFRGWLIRGALTGTVSDNEAVTIAPSRQWIAGGLFPTYVIDDNARSYATINGYIVEGY